MDIAAYPVQDVLDIGSVELKVEETFSHLVFRLFHEFDIFTLCQFPANYTRRSKGLHQTFLYGNAILVPVLCSCKKPEQPKQEIICTYKSFTPGVLESIPLAVLL